MFVHACIACFHMFVFFFFSSSLPSLDATYVVTFAPETGRLFDNADRNVDVRTSEQREARYIERESNFLLLPMVLSAQNMKNSNGNVQHYKKEEKKKKGKKTMKEWKRGKTSSMLQQKQYYWVFWQENWTKRWWHANTIGRTGLSGKIQNICCCVHALTFCYCIHLLLFWKKTDDDNDGITHILQKRN